MTLYDDDVYGWAFEQATLLRVGAWDKLDLEHLIEEIEDVGHSQRDKLESHLLVLLTHLLKLQWTAQHLPHDYARAARGWRQTCRAQRLQIATVLERNYTLRGRVLESIRRVYRIARLEAAAALDIEEDLLPAAVPWPDAQALADDVWPDAPVG
jgi:uncharacterized protein DUF29